MIRHIFLAKVTASASSEMIEEWTAAINGLPEHIPELMAITAGRRSEESTAPYDIAVVADFATMQDWAVYRDHPAHQAVKARLTDKIVEAGSRATIQIVQ